MIWESKIVMTLIDIAILAATLTALWILVKGERARWPARSGKGPALMVSGLLVIGLFCAADLFVMLALPVVVTPATAMAVMEDLRLNYSWIPKLFGILLGVVGFAVAYRELGKAIVGLKRSEEDRGRELRERQAAEDELLASEQRFRVLADAAFEGIGISENGTVVDASQRLADMLGYDIDDLRGAPISQFVAPPSRRAVEEKVASGCGESYEHLARRKDGSTFPVVVRGKSVRIDGREIRVSAIRDVTDWRAAEAEIRASRESLRSLAARLHAVREEERTAIAREIHDALGQALTGLKMNVAWLAGRLSEGSGEERDLVEQIATQLDETLEDVRHLASRLRPPVLDDLGLAAAIEWQVEEFRERTGVHCYMEITGDDASVSHDHATAAFRIIQESLTNIARHAEAQHVCVRLDVTASDAVAIVDDDGRGISDEHLEAANSLGLLGMRERAAALGGDVNIERTNVGGTRVTLRLPTSPTGTPDDLSVAASP